MRFLIFQGDPNCAGYTQGLNVTQHAANGVYDGAAVTTWKRGSPAAVIWKADGKHRGGQVVQMLNSFHNTIPSLGGYAYRLCKLGKDGYAGITEECFQEGQLKFYGPDNWLQLLSGDTVVATLRQTAIRVTEGTTPEGSEWTTWPFSSIRETFPDQKFGWKDMVEVPESLEPGSYVLSFRWDCQQTPQIWQTCANIEII